MKNVFVLAALAIVSLATQIWAQTQDITIATVTRAPFSMEQNGRDVGFSIELWEELGTQLDLNTTFLRTDSFSEMLDAVKNGVADGAIANISITAAREADMDFTQPIFDSGLQILIPYEDQDVSVFSALFTGDILLAIVIAIVLLFGGGMLMWVFERNASDYFRRPARQAAFPAFWWALNLVVNGGFEERMPNSRAGRGFAVLLVVASLFVVSVFVATITSAMTVNALQSSITGLSDLEGKRVGTISQSTAAQFMENRDVAFIAVDDLETLFEKFENGDLDAVIFDKPILAYYVSTRGAGIGRLVERVFNPESYGIALPTGSPLREQLNQSLLRLREDGTYDALRVKWFGTSR
ncbi:transporter substrate-binding domain-containing protein [Sulfitobacter sp. HNIBRBA2951]|uniref:transporter substrate-binding domain-containing protein n=1 Tax=Sulfitobacter aquimarinus TaxID=3158557 RepID=UPI0032DEFF66